MMKSIFLLCATFIVCHALAQSAYKQDFDDAMKRSNWTKTTYSPMLTGQWMQNGNLILTINQGVVKWGDGGDYQMVEWFTTPESFVIIAKRPESYGGDPPQPCYYAIYVRNLTELNGSFAIMKGVCTSRTGEDEYFHGVGRIADGITDEYASQNGVFFSCAK
jgi:hypothetical protein